MVNIDLYQFYLLLHKIALNDNVRRAAWTFAQGFLGALLVTDHLNRAALIGAVAAGLSALKGYAKYCLSSRT
jgi:hypothetical protein